MSRRTRDLCTTAEAANRLKMSERGVRKAIATGRLKAMIWFGNAWSIDVASVEKLRVERLERAKRTPRHTARG